MIANTESGNPAATASNSSDQDTPAGQAAPTAQQGPPPAGAGEQSLSQMQVPTTTKEYMKSRVVASNFGNIVTVLMQSPAHKNKKLADLRESVVPALLNNQFRVAEAHKKGSGYTIPVGIILWARVSSEVDQRLSNADSEDVKLSAQDWVSGDILWITEAVGEQRFITKLMQDLVQKDFKGKQVKYRRKTEKGIEVAVLKP